MNAQSAIIRACTHVPEGHPKLVRLDGEDVACCGECWNASVAARKAARAAQLAALPRCEVPKCARRARFRCGPDGVGLCGAHLARAKAARIDAAGPLAFVVWAAQEWVDRESLLRFAQAPKRGAR
jgi:hypothetical protein